MTQEITRRTHAMAHPLDRIFNGWLSNEPFFAFLNPAADEGSLALDVSENDEQVIVRASLPGFSREQVRVEVNDGVLTISGQRSEEHEEKGEKFYRRERRLGSVTRSVALPTAVDEDNARAELADGVLTLRLPKAARARRRTIDIA